MSDFLASSWIQDLVVNLAASLVLFGGGYLIGKWRGRRQRLGRNLEQYDFYPFVVDAQGFPQFSLELFERGVEHLLANVDTQAAGQMIIIGEQNGVRYQLKADALARYEKFHQRYHGKQLLQDSSDYLDNYRRIVRLFGNTLRGMGIEILLHDLVNPSRSITCIVGGEVTGRAEGMGTTQLVMDLKRRRLLNQDKLNYGLEIGSRRRYCATEMKLDENILSRPEYEKAVAGKRHWRHEPNPDLLPGG